MEVTHAAEGAPADVEEGNGEAAGGAVVVARRFSRRWEGTRSLGHPRQMVRRDPLGLRQRKCPDPV